MPVLWFSVQPLALLFCRYGHLHRKCCLLTDSSSLHRSSMPLSRITACLPPWTVQQPCTSSCWTVGRRIETAGRALGTLSILWTRWSGTPPASKQWPPSLLCESGLIIGLLLVDEAHLEEDRHLVFFNNGTHYIQASSTAKQSYTGCSLSHTLRPSNAVTVSFLYIKKIIYFINAFKGLNRPCHHLKKCR